MSGDGWGVFGVHVLRRGGRTSQIRLSDNITPPFFRTPCSRWADSNLIFTIFALRIEYVGTLWEIGAILFLVVTVAVSLGIFTLISSRAVDFSVGLLQVFDVSDALLVFVLGWDYMSRTFGKLDQCWDVAFSVLDYV